MCGGLRYGGRPGGDTNGKHEVSPRASAAGNNCAGVPGPGRAVTDSDATRAQHVTKCVIRGTTGRRITLARSTVVVGGKIARRRLSPKAQLGSVIGGNR